MYVQVTYHSLAQNFISLVLLTSFNKREVSLKLLSAR